MQIYKIETRGSQNPPGNQGWLGPDFQSLTQLLTMVPKNSPFECIIKMPTLTSVISESASEPVTLVPLPCINEGNKRNEKIQRSSENVKLLIKKYLSKFEFGNEFWRQFSVRISNRK